VIPTSKQPRAASYIKHDFIQIGQDHLPLKRKVTNPCDSCVVTRPKTAARGTKRFSLQSGLKLMTTRMMDKDLTN